MAAHGHSGEAEPPDELLLSVVFRQQYLPLLRLASCLVRESDVAEDVVQDAFLSLHRHAATLRNRQAAEAYLRAAVVNGSRSHVRRLVRERLRRRPAAVHEVSSEERALERDEHRRVFDVIQTLPRRQREVLACRYYLELSEAETADLLGLARGTVKRHAFRALRTVESRLEVTA